MKRFEIWVTTFDPSVGSEIRKKRPAVIISDDESNKYLATVIVAPLTTTRKPYPSRYPIDFEGNGGDIALDQLKCMDKTRLTKKIGQLSEEEAKDVCDILTAMFHF